MIAHSQAVFMAGSEEDAELAGGGADWIFTVQPLGPVQKHDINWSSHISCLAEEDYEPNDPEVVEAALNYWNGVPHPDENLWEYLTTYAEILTVETF